MLVYILHWSKTLASELILSIEAAGPWTSTLALYFRGPMKVPGTLKDTICWSLEGWGYAQAQYNIRNVLSCRA